LREVGDPWAHLERFWFDTIAHDRAALAYLVERVTPARVVLGTDLPFDMAPADPVGQVREALDHDVAQLVLGNGAESLVGARRS
jgi:aminocarboxymuconate-semialdehyde decarboxylase